MIEYIKYFFNPSHIFTLRPDTMQPRALIILAVIFLLCIALAIISKIVAKKTNDGLKLKAYRQVFSLFLTMGILGIVYLFFAWQAVTLLASRFWLLIWVVVVAVWLGFIAKYFFLDIPKTRTKIDKKKNFNKYIP